MNVDPSEYFCFNFFILFLHAKKENIDKVLQNTLPLKVNDGEIAILESNALLKTPD